MYHIISFEFLFSQKTEVFSQVTNTMEVKGPIYLPHDQNYLLSGPIGSGKSFLLSQIIKYRHMLFKEKIETVYYFYGVWTDSYTNLQSDPNVILMEGLPTTETIKTLKPGSMIVFDDLGYKLFQNDSILEIALVMCRHKHMTTFVLLHNLFTQGKNARTFFLNTGVYIIFETRKGIDQIKLLGRQIFASSDYLLQSYKLALEHHGQFGYLLIDLVSKIPEEVRLRTCILPGEEMICFKPI